MVAPPQTAPFFKSASRTIRTRQRWSTPVRGKEDLDGLFSGFDPAIRRYNTKSRAYQTEVVPASMSSRVVSPSRHPPVRRHTARRAESAAKPAGRRCPEFCRARRQTGRWTAAPGSYFAGSANGVPASQAAYVLLRLNWLDRCAARRLDVYQKFRFTEQQRPRQDQCHLLRCGLDAGRRWRAVDPHAGILQLALRRHRATRRRHSGAARPRHPSGGTDIATLYNIHAGYLDAPNVHR